MKYLSLVWAQLFRSKTRTLLTLLSVVTAFLLFGMLDSVRVAFNSGGSVEARACFGGECGLGESPPYAVR